MPVHVQNVTFETTLKTENHENCIVAPRNLWKFSSIRVLVVRTHIINL